MRNRHLSWIYLALIAAISTPTIRGPVLRHRVWAFAAIMALLMAFATVAAAQENMGEAADQARGAFTCDFALPGDFPQAQLGPALERDRMYMAARPGMLHNTSLSALTH